MSGFSPNEFSRATGLSAKALRLYESRGLLAPADVDPSNGYRTYAHDQLVVASRIALLRRAGIGLADIGRFLAAPSASAIDAWIDQVEADRNQRRLALTELAYALGLRAPDREEPLMAITIRSVDSLDELTTAFDLAGAQFEPPIDHRDERRFGDLAAVFPAQRDLLLIAEDGDTTVGAALGFTNDGTSATLRLLAVDEAHRRRGVGAELLRAFERGVRRAGAATVNLGADEAVGFYVRHGYQTLFLFQWVYDASLYEAEVDALLSGPLKGTS